MAVRTSMGASDVIRGIEDGHATVADGPGWGRCQLGMAGAIRWSSNGGRVKSS